jgi:hypothetical protein
MRLHKGIMRIVHPLDGLLSLWVWPIRYHPLLESIKKYIDGFFYL